MKGFVGTAAAATLLGASGVAAFPTLNLEGNNRETQNAVNLGKRGLLVGPQGAGALPLVPPTFDPVAQHVSTTGQYTWVAPTSTDIRGECPGLNALANHGYLPHNGKATISQFIDATYTGVGMERDLGGFLALYGAVIDGDLTSWTLLGGPREGIGGSHHNYEADSSPFKPDLNQYGSNSRFVMAQFQKLFNMQPNPATANYNLEVFREFRHLRFQDSVQKNPYFFNGPFDGVEVSQAAYTFIYRFMSNKSAENPEGVLNQDVLKTWHSVSGSGDSMVHTPGHERIPDNFYKRHPSDSYSVPYFEADILFFAAKYPEILDIGCNSGTVNSYAPISPSLLTGGALTSLTSSPFCSGLYMLQAGGTNLTGLTTAQLAPLQSGLSSALKAGNCAANPVKSVDTSKFSVCPGFTLYGGPTGPVAPGAIQDGPLS